jgi:serine/threonine protein phosphatase PrpC
MNLLIASRTLTGRRRRVNEDRLLVEAFTESVHSCQWTLLAVADGVGGGPGGDVASQLAVTMLRRRFHDGVVGDPANTLRSIYGEINSAIYSLAQRKHRWRGMGTTLATALVGDNALYVGNVGDSRVYLVRHGEVEQLTRDHTWVAELERAGHPSTEARRSSRRHMLVRILGVEPEVVADIMGPRSLVKGDILVLCSDGLYNLVSPGELQRACLCPSPDEGVEWLVELVISRGTPDDASVIVAKAC